jgi:acetyl esterase/lipase
MTWTGEQTSNLEIGRGLPRAKEKPDVAQDNRTVPGDIDELVAADHAAIEGRLQHIEAGRGRPWVIARQVEYELTLHMDVGERILLPAVAEQMPGHARAGQEEHRAIRSLLSAVEDSRPGSAEWDAALTELLPCVRAHVAAEESDLLPRLRDLVGADRMHELGRAFWAFKREAPSRPHPLAPDGPRAHALLDRLEAVVDTWRDRHEGRTARLLTDASGLLDPDAQRLIDAWAGIGMQPVEILPPALARMQPTLEDAVRTLELGGRMPRGPGANPVHERLWRQELRRPIGAIPAAELPPVVRGPDFEVWSEDAHGDPLILRAYRPAGSPREARLPILVWLHGGNWVLHTLADYDGSCRGLANGSGAVVVAPDYHLAPEFAFPAAYDDVAAVWRWLRRRAEEVGGDPDRIAIGGEDAGGTMAAATARAVATAGFPGPKALVLACPITTLEPYGASMTDSADAAPLSRPVLAWSFAHAFFDDPTAAPGDSRVNLLGWKAEDLASLPPTLVLTAGRDPLRSQGRRFAELAEAAGVPVLDRCYDGMPHGFLSAPSVLKAAADAQGVAASFLREHLA